MYEDEQLLTAAEDYGDDNDDDELHQLDSSSICKEILNKLFYVWIFKIIKIGKLENENILKVPPYLRSNTIYTKWQHIFNEREQNHLSTSTFAMIYHTEKALIIKLITLEVISYGLIMFALYIFKCNLWPSLNNSDTVNIAKYGLLIFMIFTIKSILIAYCETCALSMRSAVSLSLYLSIYYKTTSLDLNECNKQQVLSIIGNDVNLIRHGVLFLTNFTVPILIAFIFSLIILYYIIGISSLVGIMFIIFVGVPFQLYCGYKLSYYNDLKMRYSDKRIQLITELLRGIREIKYNAQEVPLMNMVNLYRNQELDYTKTRNFYLSLIVLANFLIPTFMLFITLLIYCFIVGNNIDSNITVFILILLSLTQLGVKGIPIIVGNVVSFFVSCNRIDEFNKRISVDMSSNHYVDNNNMDDTAIKIENGTFVWLNHDKQSSENDIDKVAYSIKNISIRIKKRKLIAIIGSVGSGKTSLLHAILNEMKLINGEINVDRNKIIYCSQTPYIRNATLRDNVIMELPFDEIKYKQCIVSAALQYDIQQLPHRDLTLIGDEGVNLSGGQKMRISFARTLYRSRKHVNSMNNHIFLFDDLLSSVDIYTGKQMFFNGIYKYLLDKKGNKNNIFNTNNNTCLMVINSHLNLLKYFDEIVIMDEGQVQGHKTIKDLFFNDSNKNLFEKYKHILPNINQLDSVIHNNEYHEFDENDNDDIKSMEEDIDINFDENIESNDINWRSSPNWKLFSQFVKSSMLKFDYKSYWYDNRTVTDKLENIENNKTKLLILFIPLILCFIIQCAAPICDLCILIWNQHIENNQNNLSVNMRYLSIWFLSLCLVAFATLYFSYFWGNIVLKSAHYIHSKALYNILRANTLFFDITPRGSMMNIFTTETTKMDIVFTDHTYQFILLLSSVIGYFILIIIFIPYSLIPILLIIAPMLFYLNYKFQISHLSAILSYAKCEAPINSLFSEMAVSLDSIRSMKLQTFFVKKLQVLVDNTQKYNIIASYLNGWITLYQEMLLNALQLIVIMIAAYYISSMNNKSNKQFAILSCWFCFNITLQISLVSKMWCYSKECFSSIINLMYYHNLKDEIFYESKQINHKYRIGKDIKWPQFGNLTINKLQLKYRKKFDMVLDIDKKIEINHGDKVGICGRTGSGKSSILVSIFRLFEPFKDSNIIIDNRDIYKLGLYDLRTNLSIISQHPVLFNGTLRFNLDPFDKYSDEEIWESLKCVQLFELINNREKQLLCMIEENGLNFSQGQRQLLCFAKALLKKSQILFMDEATSSIDKYTDSIIQSLIRSDKFKNITVICIAHRLQTIIDYDYILLIKNGKVKQYDTPKNLLSDKNGDFANLLKTDKLYYN